MRKLLRSTLWAAAAGLISWGAGASVLFFLFAPIAILGGPLWDVVVFCASLGWMLGVVVFVVTLFLGLTSGS